MAYQTESADLWPGAVYQIAVTDPVLGGPEGPVNLALAALATRSRYQRIRNVTPWNATHEYPAQAYCQVGGVTYKSLTANTNVQPGTVPAANVWIRWGYTADELLEFINGVLSVGALASIQFSTLADATGAVPGGNYTVGMTGNLDANTGITNPSSTKRLRIFVISASCRLWNKGGNTAILGGAGFVKFGAGGFNTVSFAGSVPVNQDSNGGGQFNSGVTYTLDPNATVTITNRFTWAINSAGAVNGGQTLCTSNVLIAKFELPV